MCVCVNFQGGGGIWRDSPPPSRGGNEASSAERRGELEASACNPSGSHLCLGDGGGAFVLLRQEEADGHEEFVDADSELLLVLAARGQREEAAGLDDVLEDVLAGLEGRRANKRGRIHYYYTLLH